MYLVYSLSVVVYDDNADNYDRFDGHADVINGFARAGETGWNYCTGTRYVDHDFPVNCSHMVLLESTSYQWVDDQRDLTRSPKAISLRHVCVSI
jgi:hypothetical protein